MKKIFLALVMALMTVWAVSAQNLTNPALTTTPSVDITASQTVIPFTAVSGQISVAGQATTTRALQRGDGAFIDGEYMAVSSSYTAGSLQVPVLRGQLGTTAKAHESASTIVFGPPAIFSTADPGGEPSGGSAACPGTPQPYLVLVNVKNGNAWLCRQTSSTVRIWVATNSRQLTYNSLTVR